jgi:hypothetical protein
LVITAKAGGTAPHGIIIISNSSPPHFIATKRLSARSDPRMQGIGSSICISNICTLSSERSLVVLSIESLIPANAEC